ncbi:MAG: AI-2E family transporter [Thermoanaerobaculia bacterium]
MKLSSADPARFERRAFLGFAAAILLAFAWLVVRPLLAPILLAVLSAVIVQPLHQRLERHLGRRAITSLLTTVILTLLVALPLGGIVLLFLVQAREVLAEYLGEEANRGRIVELLHQLTNWASTSAKAVLGDSFNLQELFQATLRRIGTTLYERLPDVVGLGGRLLLGALLLYVVLFMLLLRGRELVDLLVELSPLGDRHTRRILGRLEDTINGVFLGSLATALAQGSIGAVGFWLLGFQNVLVLGVLIAGAGLVPVVGTALVWLPAALALFLGGQTGAALGMLVIGAIVGTVDNFVKPILIHGRAEVHPVLVFVGLLGGLRSLGGMGLVYGPLLVACLTEMVRIYRDDFGRPAAPTPEPEAGGRVPSPSPEPAAPGTGPAESAALPPGH